MKAQNNNRPRYGFVAVRYFAIIGLIGLIILIVSLSVYTFQIITSPANVVFLLVGIPVAYACLQMGLSYIPFYYQLLKPPRIPNMWKKIVRTVNLTGEISILDIGCGTGMVSISLAHQLPQAHVTGIDLFHGVSGSSPIQPIQNAQAEGVDNRVSFKQGSLLHIPFPNNSFDVVTAGSVLHEIHGNELRLQAFSEIKRVLKPNGKFISVEILRDRKMKIALLLFSRVWETKEYWKNIHEQGGFNEQKIEDFEGFLNSAAFICEKAS